MANTYRQLVKNTQLVEITEVSKQKIRNKIANMIA